MSQGVGDDQGTWTLTADSTTDSSFALHAKGGTFDGWFLGFNPTPVGGILYPILSNAGSAFVWEIKEVEKTRFPETPALTIDSVDRTAADLAIQTTFQLAGAAVATQVPGGDIAFGLLYQLLFPGTSLDKVLQGLQNKIVHQVEGMIADEAVSSAITKLGDIRRELYGTATIGGSNPLLVGTYFTQRASKLGDSQFVAAAGDALTLANDLGLNVLDEIWRDQIDGAENDADAVVSAMRVLNGYWTFAAGAAMQWVAYQDYLALSACHPDGQLDQNIDDVEGGNGQVGYIPTQQARLQKMFDLVLKRRQGSVQLKTEHSTSAGTKKGSIVRHTHMTMSEEGWPGAVRTLFEMRWDGDSGKGATSGSGSWVAAYKAELAFDYRVRFPQVAMATPAYLERWKAATNAMIQTLKTDLVAREAYRQAQIAAPTRTKADLPNLSS